MRVFESEEGKKLAGEMKVKPDPQRASFLRKEFNNGFKGNANKMAGK